MRGKIPQQNPRWQLNKIRLRIKLRRTREGEEMDTIEIYRKSTMIAEKFKEGMEKELSCFATGN